MEEIKEEISLNDRSAVLQLMKAGEESGKVQIVFNDGEKTHFLIKDGYSKVAVYNNNDRPKRKTGRIVFTSVLSFCSYVAKHKNVDETIIIADVNNGLIQATFNHHSCKEPSWGDFKADLRLTFSRKWKTWLNESGSTGESFSQEELSDFLEENRSDLVSENFLDADGKEVETLTFLQMTALITKLEITKEEKFSRKIDPINGDVKMSYENEEVSGDIKIPREFYIILPIFESGDLFRLKVRLRSRLVGGKVTFHFIIDQAEEAVEKAFSNICHVVQNGRAVDEEAETKDVDFCPATFIDVFRGPIS